VQLNPNHALSRKSRERINPDYSLDHELHELTQIKTIKSIGLDLDEYSFRGLFMISLIFICFIRVIRGLLHYLG